MLEKFLKHFFDRWDGRKTFVELIFWEILPWENFQKFFNYI